MPLGKEVSVCPPKHAVNPSMGAPTPLPCGVGFQRAQHSLPLRGIVESLGEGRNTP